MFVGLIDVLLGVKMLVGVGRFVKYVEIVLCLCGDSSFESGCMIGFWWLLFVNVVSCVDRYVVFVFVRCGKLVVVLFLFWLLW